jgi:hypothetical protein
MPYQFLKFLKTLYAGLGPYELKKENLSSGLGNGL